jgi:putative transposase
MRVYRIIVSQVQRFKCQTIAINSMEDHIHLMVKFPAAMMIAELVKQAKGVSSHFINQEILINDHFKWGIGYGAFTISRWDMDKIANIIKRQKEHHMEGYIIKDIENISRF